MNPQEFILQSAKDIQNSKSLDYDLITNIFQDFVNHQENDEEYRQEYLSRLLPKIMRQIRKCHESFITIKTAMREMKINVQKELKKNYGDSKRLYIPSVYVHYLKNYVNKNNKQTTVLDKVLIFGNCNSQDRINLFLSPESYYFDQKLNLEDNNYICNNLDEVYELLSYFIPGFHKDNNKPCFGDFEEFYQF